MSNKLFSSIDSLFDDTPALSEREFVRQGVEGTLPPEQLSNGAGITLDQAKAQLDNEKYGAIDALFADDFNQPDPYVAGRNDPDRTWGEAAKDTGAAVMGGFANMGGGIVHLADTLTGGLVDIGAREAFKDAGDYWEGAKSDALKSDKEKLAATNGFLPTIRTLFENPRLIGDIVAGSTPYLLPTGAAARVGALGKTGEAAIKAGATAAAMTGGVLEGADAGSSVYNEVMEMTPEQLFESSTAYKEMVDSGLSHNQALEKLAYRSGITATAITTPIAVLASKLTGAARLESEFFTGNGVRDLLSTMTKEGAEEVIQEGSNAFGGNVGVRVSGADENRDLTQGVSSSAATGLVAGASQAGGMKGIGTLNKMAARQQIIDQAGEDARARGGDDLDAELAKAHKAVETQGADFGDVDAAHVDLPDFMPGPGAIPEMTGTPNFALDQMEGNRDRQGLLAPNRSVAPETSLGLAAPTESFGNEIDYRPDSAIDQKAEAFEDRHLNPKEPEPLAPIESRYRKPNVNSRTIDPDVDDIMLAIAKSGGLNFDNMAENGLDPAYRNKRIGIRAVFTENGKTLDGMAEHLSQFGYLGDNYTANELLDKVMRSLGGEEIYTPSGYSNLVERQAMEAEEDHQARLNEAQAAAEELRLEPMEVDVPESIGKPEVSVATMIGTAMGSGVSGDVVNNIVELTNSAEDTVAQLREAIKEAEHDRLRQEGSNEGRISNSAATEREEEIPGWDETEGETLTDEEIDNLFSVDSSETDFSLSTQTEQELANQPSQEEIEAQDQKDQVDREQEHFGMDSGGGNASNVGMGGNQSGLFTPTGEATQAAQSNNEEVTQKYRDWPLLDELPSGWKFDKTAGSPVHGYEFATNGKNILTGQQKRALVRVSPSQRQSGKTEAAQDEEVQTVRLFDGSSHKTREDVEQAFSEAKTDDELYERLRFYRQSDPQIKRIANEVFDEIASFYVYSENAMLKAVAETSYRRTSGKEAKDSILNKHDKDLAGVQLSNEAGDRFAVLMPDATEPGRFRVSYFDERGFSGHSTRDSYQTLLDEAFQDGFRKEVTGKLEELSQTERFAEGNELATDIGKVNSGTMTWGEFSDKHNQKPKFDLSTQTEEELANQPSQEELDTAEQKDQVDREREHFGLDSGEGNASGEGMGGNQGGLFTPDGNASQAAKSEDVNASLNEKAGVYSNNERESSPIQSREPDSGEYEQTALNLSSGPALPGDKRTAKAQIRDTLHQIWKLRTTGQIAVGTDTINTAEDAAHVVAGLRKSAQEQFFIVITDGDGKILSVVRHGKGAKDAATIYPAEVAAAVAGVDGAKKAWLAHNHPSGTLRESDADRHITKSIKSAMDGLDAELAGHIVLGHDGQAVHLDSNGNQVSQINAKPLPRSRSANVVERVLVKRGENLTKITGPRSAIMAAEEIKSNHALLLLNTQNALVGVVSMSPKEMNSLRKNGRVKRILNAIGQTNTKSVIVKTSDQLAAKNVSAYINQLQTVDVLDWLNKNEKGNYESDAAKGGTVIGHNGPFYSKGSTNGNGASQVKQWLSKPLSKLGDWVDVEVVQSVSDIPGNHPADVRGMYHNGKVWLVADNITQDDAKTVLAHEVVGHLGLETLLGKKAFDQVLRQVQNMKRAKNKRVNEIVGQLKKNYVDKDGNYTLDEKQESREILAHLAESNPDVGVIRKIKARIKLWLARHGFGNFDDAMLESLIVAAARHTQTNYSGFIEESGQMVPAYSGNPNESDKIGSFSSKESDEVMGEGGRHTEAWKRAEAKGLDMSKEARMQRARDMGFDTDELYTHSGQRFEEIKPEGLFDGVFASYGDTSEHGGGDYETSFIFRRPVAGARDWSLDYDQSMETLKREYPGESDEFYDTLYEWAAEDKADPWGDENILENHGFDAGEASWEAQRLRGRIAVDQGFDAIAMSDEHGTSYLIPSGSKAKPIDSVFDPDESGSSNIMYSRKATQDTSTPQRIKDIADKVLAVPQEQKTYRARIADWVKSHLDMDKTALKQGLLDAFASIEDLEKRVSGGVLDASQSAYKAALRTKNIASVMGAVMNKGSLVYKEGGVELKEGSKGFLEIFEPLADKGLMRTWEAWAGAVRAERLMSEGRENLYTQEQIDELKDYVDSDPELKALFESVHKGWQSFNKDMLDFAESAGLINAEERELWEHDDYVPFHRVANLEEVAADPKSPRKSGGLSGQRSGIKHLEGGVEQISIVEAMVQNMTHLVDASFKNIAMQRVVDLALETKAVEPIATSRLTLEEIRNKLDLLGIDHEGLTDKQLRLWRAPLTRSESGHGTVTVSVDGKVNTYMVHDPLLLRSMTAMGPDGIEGIMKLFSFSKRLLTTMVTSDPSFAIRNLIRDSLSTAVVVNQKLNPLTAAIKGARKSIKNDDSQWAMMAAGGGGGGYYDIDPSDVRHHLSGLKQYAGLSNVLYKSSEMWKAYQKVLGAGENANRISVYDAVIKAGGTKAEAAHQAQDVLNFSKHGDYKAVRVLIQMVPFMNARVQGLDRLYRGALENPAAFALKGSIIMGATLALLAANWDNDDYWDLPEWDRDTYYHFWVGDEHYRLPKPFEVGAIFSTIPERMFEQMRDDANSKLLGERMLHMVRDTFALDITPQLFRPLIEVGMNTNRFTGAPIVSKGMSYAAPEAQYSPFTSETMRVVAEAMPDFAPDWMRSPVRLQHVFKGYLGTLGGYALLTSDLAVREASGLPVKPSLRIRDIPVAKSFVRDGVGSTKHANRVYEMAKEVDELYSAIRKYQKEGNLESVQKAKERGRDKLAKRRGLNSAVKKMSNISAQTRRIYDNKILSAEQKRKKIDELSRQRNKIAKQAFDKYWADF